MAAVNVRESKAVRAVYNRLAPGYVNLYRSVQLYAPTVEAFLRRNAKPGVRLLDVGCGPANLTRALPPSVRVTGVDLSPQMLAQARRARPGGIFKTYDYHTPFPKALGQFDVVLALGTFEFCRDLDTAVANLARASNPGARILLTVVERRCAREAGGPWRRQVSAKYPDVWVYSYSEADMRRAFRKAGLRIVRRRFQRGWWQRRPSQIFYYGIWELVRRG